MIVKMCELFGISANKPVSVRFLWRGIVKRGLKHRDGWGVAFYPDGKAVCLIKEPASSISSPMAEFLKSHDFIRSRVLISHVRTASKGEVAYRNTHPFVRELFGKEWCFAHNGTLLGELPASTFYKPVGETDSEKAFCLIMDRLKKLGPEADVEDEISLVEDSTLELSERAGKEGGFNFLMSDGMKLYAFWSGYNELHYVVRAPPHMRKVSIVDDDFKVDLGEIKGRDEVATIIATRPLTDESWIRFPCRKLLVFENGLIRLRESEWKILDFVRHSPHRVSLRETYVEFKVSIGEAEEALKKLMVLGLIRQDRRDTVRPSHPDATFFTEHNIRGTIDSMLRVHRSVFKERS
jgi:glutamine amidotransferase